MEILSYFQEAWVWRAIIASSVVGVMCGALGSFIVLRQMSMIGDALSHSILPGVVIAFAFLGYNVAGFFLGSLIAGIITAIGITWAQQKVKTKSDAAIGIIFTAMFSIGVIGISYLSNTEGVHLDLKDFLFGNVLGVSDEDLWLSLIIAIYVLLMLFFFYRALFISTFQPTIAAAMGIPTQFVHYMLMILLSFSVVSALQTVGVILVVAMLITPASSALLWFDNMKRVIIFSAIIGLFSALLGMYLAIRWDTTPGPAMALVATGFYFLSALGAPEKGLLAKSIRKYQLKRRIKVEDIIKLIYRNEGVFNKATEVSKKMGLRRNQTRRLIRLLIEKGLIVRSVRPFELTPAGKAIALRLIRAHRLWETYLVNEMGMSPNQIHEEAERYEHYITEDLLEELNDILGAPSEDPHGSPIPDIQS